MIRGQIANSVGRERDNGLEVIGADDGKADAVDQVQTSRFALDLLCSLRAVAAFPSGMPGKRLRLSKRPLGYRVSIEVVLFSVAIQPFLRPLVDDDQRLRLLAMRRQTGDDVVV